MDKRIWIRGIFAVSCGEGMRINMKKHIELKNKTIFVTGAAGFIGFHLVKRLLKICSDSFVIGIDNINDYYDINLKNWRKEKLLDCDKRSSNDWKFIKESIAERKILDDLFECYQPEIVINLAAQAGVRYSIKNPDTYIESNLIGFYNILEACRHNKRIEHFIYASSSSVYGGNKKVPFSTEDNVDHPESLYAATKKCDELLSYSYSKLYNIPTTGLRLFTVYGPAGRPDMAYFSFTEKLKNGEKIPVFNYGNCERDFTYIDDIIEGIMRVIENAPVKSTEKDGSVIPPYRIYNIGGGKPENLMEFIHILSQELIREGILKDDFDLESHIEFLPMQLGDVPITYADSSAFEKEYGFKPEIDIKSGLHEFVKWYKEYSSQSLGK